MTAARVPRSTDARSHGRTRPRRGELSLVPDVPRQVRRVHLVVEQLEEGRLRVTMPAAPGWVAVGRTPVEIVQVLRRAYTEAQVVAHSKWRGHVYDHPAEPQHRRHKPRSRGKRRCDVFSPETWALDDAGKWVSPGAGHRYPEDRQVVQRVKAARRALGLPERPGQDESRERLEQLTGTQMSLRVDENGQT